MSNQQLNNSEVRAEQAASKPHQHQIIKLGLDIHAESIVVVRILDNSAPQPAQKFLPSKFLAWVQTQLAQAGTVHSCYEAGPFGFVLHRQLTALGVKNLVAQPVCLDEHRKNVNNDQRDARELAQRLDRYVAGNSCALATVRVPTPEEEQRRIQSRQREQLRREVHRVAAQGRSLLLSQGHRQKGSWWEDRRWAKLHLSLPAWLTERLEVFRRLLERLSEELQAATDGLEASAPGLRPKGLGGLTDAVMEREVGQWSRFNNRRQVASYTGLCGGVSASGNSQRLLSTYQAWQCPAAHRPDRTGLALGALATAVRTGAQMVQGFGLAQSQPGRAQESDRGPGAPTGGGPLALAHRQSQTRPTGLGDGRRLKAQQHPAAT